MEGLAGGLAAGLIPAGVLGACSSVSIHAAALTFCPAADSTSCKRAGAAQNSLAQSFNQPMLEWIPTTMMPIRSGRPAAGRHQPRCVSVTAVALRQGVADCCEQFLMHAAPQTA